MRKKKLFKILFFLIFFIFPFSLFALNLRIDIPKVKLKVEGAKVYRGEITIENPSSQTGEVKVYVEDFLYIPPYDGSKEFFPPGTTGFSCAKWISFSPHEVVLPPFGRRKIRYSINVPQGVEGGYYAVMFFESSLGKIKGKDAEMGAEVVILGRVGTLFFLETEGRIKKAQIRDIRASGNRIKGEFLNRGNVVLVSKGSFYIMNNRGIVVDRGRIADIYIFPGDKTFFDLKVGEGIPPGKYTIVCSFDLEDGDILVKEIDILKERLGSIRVLSTRD